MHCRGFANWWEATENGCKILLLQMRGDHGEGCGRRREEGPDGQEPGERDAAEPAVVPDGAGCGGCGGDGTAADGRGSRGEAGERRGGGARDGSAGAACEWCGAQAEC